MPVPSWRSQLDTSASDFEEVLTLGELDPGERICPPRARAGDSSMLSSFIVILVALGGGWALLRYQPNLPDRLSAGIAAVSSSMGYRAGPGSAQLPAPPMPPLLPTAGTTPTPELPAVDAPLPAASEIVDAPGEGTKAASPLTTGAIASAEAEPLPAPTPDPADPYQKRAVAVGLHPDLSRVLLARLSPTDYRNAGTAIQTALAKTADNAVYVWPRQRKPELALFQVHFVPGAAPHCRRYVVTVTKDGWSTTAPPMERCDSSQGGRGH